MWEDPWLNLSKHGEMGKNAPPPLLFEGSDWMHGNETLKCDASSNVNDAIDSYKQYYNASVYQKRSKCVWPIQGHTKHKQQFVTGLKNPKLFQ